MPSRPTVTTFAPGACLAAVLTCVMTASPAAAYRTVTDLEGVDTPIVWRTPPRVAFDASGLSSAETSIFTDEIRAAVSVWTSIDCAAIDIGYVGTEAEAPIVIRLVDDWAAQGFAPDAPGTTELAFVLNEDGQAEIVAATIFLDATLEWRRHPEPDVERARDLRAVLVHELGHALGLAHNCEPAEGVLCSDIDESASLYPYYVGPSQAMLAEDDITGACALYPAPAGSTPPERLREQCGMDDTCATGQWCIEGTCQRDLRYGGECERSLQCLSRVCVADMTDGDTGVCSYECASDDECPASTICADVEGDDPRRVCAPVMRTSGCSVGAPSPGSPLGLLAMAATLLLMLITIRRRRHALLLPALFALIASGCGESHPVDDGGDMVLDAGPAVGRDAAPADAAIPVDAHRVDASAAPDASVDLDASSRLDAGTGADAGTFADSGVDMDAAVPGMDAAIYTDASSADAGPIAVDGGPPDAGPECVPDATRVVACGFCGSGSQGERCNATGHWEPTTGCIGGGECEAGTVESEVFERCRTNQRLCLATCAWSEWTEVRGPGDCEAGTTRLLEAGCAIGETSEETCSATCEWTETRACSDPCGGTIRTSPEHHREVCVTEGPFIRGGSPGHTNSEPVAEVYLDAYYIDRYPVTNARWYECWISGAGCSRNGSDVPDRADYPVYGVTWQEAEEFCAWDGGRRLPTEAEWEKAARGPSPRTNDYPYDGTEVRCDLIYTRDCGYVGPAFDDRPPDPVDAVPGSRSYYFTFLQAGGGFEITHDWYSPTYYSDPTSLVNPQGPATGTWHTVRGSRRRDDAASLARRLERSEGLVRCARSAP